MEEWKEYKIGDVCKIKRGASPRPIQNYISDKGMPWVKIADATATDSMYLDCTKEYIVEDGISKSVTVLPGTLIVSNSATPGLPKIIRIKACVHDGWLIISDFNGVLRDFMYYKFVDIRRHLSNQANGSVFQNLKTDIVRDFSIKIPSLETQEKIVSLLKSLDDKIDLNRRINDNLQQQAKALYKSWFEDFDPFKDGQFEDSELGLIPHGWSVKQLGEITTQVNERVKERVDVKVLSPITTGELVLSEEYFTKQVFSESISKYIVVKPTYFAYNPARVNIGSLGMNEYGFDGCVSPVYVVFRCEDDYQYFFDLFRRTETFKEEVKARAIGGVRQSLTYKDFSLIKVVYPPIDVIHSFNQVYSRILAKTKHNNVETTRLASIRDTLLLKLMSGELKIS